MEVLDFVFWFRQLLGLSLGLVAGLLHLTGMYVIIGFWGAMFILSNLYTSKVLNVSDEDFTNAELTMEGMPNSFGIFLVSTIYPLLASISRSHDSNLIYFCAADMDCLLLVRVKSQTLGTRYETRYCLPRRFISLRQRPA